MTPGNRVSIAQRMVDFTTTLDWSDLPESVRNEAVRAWLNWMACAVGGSATDAMDHAVRGVLWMVPSDAVPMPGRSERASLPDAALLGCLASTALTYDDTHFSTATHPTGPVASALISVAYTLGEQGRPVTGTALLTALVVGMELECRLSGAIIANGGHAGWFITGMSGGVGAAVAVGRLLGLTRDQMIYAIGLAATQGCGFRASHGGMAMTYVPGLAARNGLVAAYMGAADFTAGDHSIDGRNGMLQVLTGRADTTLIGDDLGSRYELMANSYKPFPCGFVIHASLDACLAILVAHPLDPLQIERIDLRVHPNALNLCWRKLPVNVFEAQVSLYHWVAAAFVTGAAGVKQGQLECVTNGDVRALQERIYATADPHLADNQAFVTVRLRDGRTVEHFTRNAIGSMTNPMSDAQLAEKFRLLTAPVLGDADASALRDLCMDLPSSADVAQVLTRSLVR